MKNYHSLYKEFFFLCVHCVYDSIFVFCRSIPSIIPVEWKKSKLGETLCSFLQIPQVDAREQLINGANEILKKKKEV